MGASVLLVEDNETNRLITREMLLHKGCSVDEAVDGIDGVEKADQNKYDLILMDISMPRLDGISATKKIRKGGGYSENSPVVALTAHIFPEDRKSLTKQACNIVWKTAQDERVKPLVCYR